MKLLLVPVEPGGADDEAEAARRLQLAEDVAQPAALFVVGDFPRDANAVEAGHEDEVSPGDADVRTQGRALGADSFLDDLHEHFLTAAEDVLDKRLGPAHAGTTHAGAARTTTAGVAPTATIAPAVATSLASFAAMPALPWLAFVLFLEAWRPFLGHRLAEVVDVELFVTTARGGVGKRRFFMPCFVTRLFVARLFVSGFDRLGLSRRHTALFVRGRRRLIFREEEQVIVAA